MRTALPPVIRARLKTCARQHPEWRSWLVLLQETLHGMDDPMWTTLELRPWGGRPARAPLLDGMELSIEKSPVQTWMRRLSVIAEREIGDRAVWSAAALNGIDVFALLAATIQQDFTRLQALAAAARASRQALQALARLAATPLLHACRHRLADALPPVWAQGYCPYCGAWAALAELRGLERTRHLRCGCCGAAWRTDWLRCSFCGEARHERLAFLVLEEGRKTHAVETCRTCQGYMKALTTLQGAPPPAVILDDMETVELDMVALERGYARPSQPGYCVNLRLVERSRTWASFLRRSS